MPLEAGKTQEAISRNIAELIKAGKDPKQAAAIAYREAGTDAANITTTKRKLDFNKWIVIKDQPITKVGVFEYSGRQVDPQFDPDEIVPVLRPEEELRDPECLASFALLPIIEDHAMLGKREDGLIPVEEKGMEGITGENPYFDFPYLRVNIKLHSVSLSDVIDGGKKDLSGGYFCVYEITDGVYNGQPYKAIQRKIRGNHVAVVEEGRTGKDVAVLDNFTFTLDSAELKNMAIPNEEVKETKETKTEVKDELSLESVMAKLDQVLAALAAKATDPLVTDNDSVTTGAEPAVDEGKGDVSIPAGGGDMSKPTDKAMDARIKAMDEKIKHLETHSIKNLMAQISKRDALATQLSEIVGVFDASDKTLEEVARYGVDKLEIDAVKGQEISALNGFFKARTTNVEASNAAVMDANDIADDQISAYLTKKGE